MFVSQIFNNFTFSGRFHGMVRFSSNVNVAILGLRQTSGASDTISTLRDQPGFDPRPHYGLRPGTQ